MPLIKISRTLFDKKAMTGALTKASSLQALREQTSPMVKRAFAEGKDIIQKRFLTSGNGILATQELALLVDAVLDWLVSVMTPLRATNHPFAVVAVGGYGRSELFLYSDVDLLFIYKTKKQDVAEEVEWLLYHLWDLGITVGQAVRSIDETIAISKKDVTTLTAHLDARWVAGDERLGKALAKELLTLRDALPPTHFVEAKLLERNERHVRTGDSRYVLEPNIKEGKGGLRDLHTLYWLAKYLYPISHFEELETLPLLTTSEYKSFEMARDFLWRCRMYLHITAGRAEERLTFDMQRAIAEAMGYFDDANAQAVEKFMKQYFIVARTVGNLTRSVCAMLEEDKKRTPRTSLASRMATDTLSKDFRLDGERLAIAHEDAFKRNPTLLITLFRIAHEQSLDIHPRTLQIISRNLHVIDGRLRRNREANQEFMKILLSSNNPEPTLRRMNEAEVLGRFIPDFGKVIGQMQFDMYHIYTVDEHTLIALGILHNISKGKYTEEMPVATEVIHLVQSLRVLFLALFAHDIAKGRGGDHSQLGEVVVRKLARRFEFDAHEEQTCAWLVRNHLLMSRTAFKRDLSDPKTIEDFVALVQSPERLRLLIVLTVCDIRAVGPHVWNGWKGALLRELYVRAEEKIGGSDKKTQELNPKTLMNELQKILPDWSAPALKQYLDLGEPAFWFSLAPPTHARIAYACQEIATSKVPMVLDISSDMYRSITEVILCTQDKKGLFSNISGAMTLAGANILSAKIFTLKNGLAVEIFHIQDAENTAFNKPGNLTRLSVLIEKVISDKLDIAKELRNLRLPYPSRMATFKVPPRVVIENKVSTHHTVVEVVGRDRMGFLFAITQALLKEELTIVTAHISTYGERAVDVFYVKDAFGMKITHESKLNAISATLLAVLSRTSSEKIAS